MITHKLSVNFIINILLLVLDGISRKLETVWSSNYIPRSTFLVVETKVCVCVSYLDLKLPNLWPPEGWDSPLALAAAAACSSSDCSRIPNWGSHILSCRSVDWESGWTSLSSSSIDQKNSQWETVNTCQRIWMQQTVRTCENQSHENIS